MNGKYDKIMGLPHHVSKTRPQMPMSDRAAQFAPFAALTGYDSAIKETGRLTDERIELDEGALTALNMRYQLLMDAVPFPVSWTVKMKKKQKETQDILSYHSQAAGCSDKARAKASGGRQPIEECGRTGL